MSINGSFLAWLQRAGDAPTLESAYLAGRELGKLNNDTAYPLSAIAEFLAALALREPDRRAQVRAAARVIQALSEEYLGDIQKND